MVSWHCFVFPDVVVGFLECFMVVAMVSQVVVRLLLPAVVYQTIAMVFYVIGIVLQGGSTLLWVSARWLLCFIR